MSKKTRLTKKEIKREIMRCGRDPVYFLKTYAKIVHQKKGLIPFDTYDFQDDLLDNFRDHRFNIVLKARQLGISTIVAGYVAWFILFRQHKVVSVLATKQSKAANIIKKVKMIFEKIPQWLLISNIDINNKNELWLKNGSGILAEGTSEDACRSEALSLLVVDECAHIGSLMDDIWTSAYSTLSTGGSAIILSTPAGTGNFFHRMCVEAENGDNEFLLTKLMWDVHPERDEDWFKLETKNLSERAIAQELLCSFNASGATVISSKDIERLEGLIKEPLYKTGNKRQYWIWEDYDPSNRYLITVDVSRGDGEDFSTIIVINLEEVNVVAEYKGKLGRDSFVSFLNSVANDYGKPMLVVENNNIGIAVAQDMLSLGYPHLYFSKKGTHEYVDPVQALSDSTAIPGFTTSVKTRPLIISKLEEYIRNRVLFSPSSRFVDELKTFIWRNGKPEAQKGSNDDLILSCAIACWVRDTALIKGQKEVEVNRALLSNILVSRKNFNTNLSNMHDIHKTGRYLEERINMQKKRNIHKPWIIVG